MSRVCRSIGERVWYLGRQCAVVAFATAGRYEILPDEPRGAPPMKVNASELTPAGPGPGPGPGIFERVAAPRGFRCAKSTIAAARACSGRIFELESPAGAIFHRPHCM